jgi:hypothetical protein
MTKDKVKVMMGMLKEFCDTELDQWEEWSLTSLYGTVYIRLSREVPEEEANFYTSVDKLVSGL